MISHVFTCARRASAKRSRGASCRTLMYATALVALRGVVVGVGWAYGAPRSLHHSPRCLISIAFAEPVGTPEVGRASQLSSRLARWGSDLPLAAEEANSLLRYDGALVQHWLRLRRR